MPELDGQPEQAVSLEQQLMQNLEAQEPDREPDGEPQGEPSPESAPDGDDEQPASPAVMPLDGWPDELKASFDSLPPAAQQALVNDYTGLRENVSTLESLKEQFEPLIQGLTPYQQVFEQHGVDFSPHLQEALKAYVAYVRDPAGTLKLLAQANHLDASALFGEQDDDEFVDPQVKALRDEIAQLKQTQANQSRQQSQQVQQKAEAVWNEFLQAKDANGNLTHPHADKLETLLAPLVAEGKTLEEAYEQVKWTYPDIRQAAMDAEKQSLQAEAQRKAKAKAASGVLPPSDGQGAPTSGSRDFSGWQAAVSETLDKLQSGD